MKRHLLSLPANHADQTKWLEELVTGPYLDEVVSDLKSSGIPEPKSLRLPDILGFDLQSVLNNGLASLERKQVRQLLSNPDALVELQELVLNDGSDHWTDLLLRESDSLFQDETSAEPVEKWIGGKDTRNDSKFLAGIAGVILALAASIFLVFRIWQGGAGGTEQPIDWGWAKVGGLPQTTERAGYLLGLASAGGEWFDKTPANADELARRIGEFRKGCEIVLAASHDPLPEVDKAWLRERCSAWKQKLADAAEELRVGTSSDEVISTVNTIARNLVKALRDRAVT